MKVVILCGGKGLRLISKTENIPKPLVEIGDKPILWHIMKIYAHYGYKDFILCLGYKGEKIKDYFMTHNSWKDVDFSVNLRNKDSIVLHNQSMNEDWNITFVDTGQETNTGGRVKRIEKFIDGEEFFLTYGDGVSNIDINALYNYHQQKGKLMTITCVQPDSPFGIVDIDDSEHVLSFVEKPKTSFWVNGGFYVCNRKIFNYFGKDDVMEVETLPRLIADRHLVAYRWGGFWQCMDTLKHVQILNDIWSKGKPEWKMWNDEKNG